MKSLIRSVLGVAVSGALFVPLATFAATTGQHLHFSNNWVGYAATLDQYAAVSATWTVASSTPTDPRLSADATWVGIGGVKSNDLIQAGTQVILHNGAAEYSAWYELLPGSQKTMTLAVHPGDRVSTSIQETGPQHWTIRMKNLTTGDTYQASVLYASSHSSAEWIVERPLAITGTTAGYLPLSNFGTVSFQGASASTVSGRGMTVAGSGAEQLLMSDTDNHLYAVPQNLRDDSFTAAYLTENQGANYMTSLRNTYTFSTPATAPAANPYTHYQQVDTRIIVHIIFGSLRPSH